MYARILLGLDGSAHSLAAGRIALKLAATNGAELLACHVYGAQMHSGRFREMEPDLPDEYQDERNLGALRDAHESLIVDGFRALSSGYMERFLAQARAQGVQAEEVSVEGRNYVRILELAEDRQADLVALGALGLGAVDGETLGSTASRVLRAAKTDLLIARKEPAGPVVAGVDGSEASGSASRVAQLWANSFEVPLCLAATYDPAFHTAIFRTMSRSLSAERQTEVGLAQQEKLHEDIIDEGLRRLYARFLDDAVSRLADAEVETALLRGKTTPTLAEHASRIGAGLLVLGRFGHHRTDIADVGSNAEGLARIASTNVLVVASRDAKQPTQRHSPSFAVATAPPTHNALQWDEDALQAMDRVPLFVRPMALRAVEDHARTAGANRVTLDFVMEVAKRMGMG